MWWLENEWTGAYCLIWYKCLLVFLDVEQNKLESRLFSFSYSTRVPNYLTHFIQLVVYAQEIWEATNQQYGQIDVGNFS